MSSGANGTNRSQAMAAPGERCPICKKALAETTRAPRPFCSARCRTVDLGRWLNEEYRVPVEDDPNDRGGGGGEGEN